MSTLTRISSFDDVITVDDLSDRLEQLDSVGEDTVLDEEDQAEFNSLVKLLAEVDNYDCETLVRDSYFAQYVQDLCEDCGDVPANLPNYIVIDWAATAENIRSDYTPFEFDGVTYWGR
jgi:hypothetical protein